MPSQGGNQWTVCIESGRVLARKLQSGQTMTEYALILALIAIAGIVTWTALGTKITSVVSSITTSL
jgi:Flp pilus assembly pilin Flp